MRASVCVGEYATIPYCVPGLEIPVYSMEELVFCLKENAFLLDVTLMEEKLPEWIEKECGLQELSEALYPQVRRQGSLSGFVSMIMSYVGLYDTADIRRIENLLKQGAGLSNIEKRKSQIDYLMSRKKYASALRGYDGLLSKWQELEHKGGEVPGASVKAAILHNRGVAYTGLMLYKQAADSFWEANQTAPNERYVLAYLSAKRMELPEREYVALVAELPDCYNLSLTLEKQLEELQLQWKLQAEYLQLKEREGLRHGSDSQKYYDENERLTLRLKHSYRNSVSE